MILGLSGYARSGKDTAAEVLVEEFGFRRVAFADKLREVLYELNPLVAVEELDRVRIGPGNITQSVEQIPRFRKRYVQDIIDYYGWDGYKSSRYGDEIRRLLQRLGTEAGRKTLWDSIWIDAAFADAQPGENIVITDCRFVNEARAIKERGGDVWRINRAGIGPATGSDGVVHESETSLDDWDFDVVVLNDGSLDQLHYKMRKLML